MNSMTTVGRRRTSAATRRNVLLAIGGGGAVALAGCLGGDGGDGSPGTDSGPDAGADSGATPSGTEGTAPVDLRTFPPNRFMDSFESFPVTFESIVLTTTGDETAAVPVGVTADLASDEVSAAGRRVAGDLPVPVGDYGVLAVHFSLGHVVASDGATATVEYASPASENVIELYDEPSTVSESEIYSLQVHFGLLSDPWTLLNTNVILGPGIPD